MVLIAPSYAQDVDTTSGPQTFTLPTSPEDNEQWRVKDAMGHAATNNITITAGGVILIDGSTTILIRNNYAALSFRWRASLGKWLVE